MCKFTWSQVMEHEALIRKCAASMVSIYHIEFDDIYNHLCMTFYDKARKCPKMISEGDGYIYTALKNEVKTWMRHGASEYTFSDVSPRVCLFAQDSEGNDIESTLSDKAIAFTLDHIDDECRELVKAILENYDDLTARAKRTGINVAALAAKLGRPKTSVYKDMERLRAKLAPVMA